MINDVDLEKVHALAAKLTGDEWCPYVSQMFADVVLSVDDGIAKSLIMKRREFLFPSFFVSEPQFAELSAHLTKRAADALEACDNNHHYISGDDPAICSCGKPVRR